MSTGNINEAYCERLDKKSLVEKISDGLSVFYDQSLLTNEGDMVVAKSPEEWTDYMQIFYSEQEDINQLLRMTAKVGDEIISVVDILFKNNNKNTFCQSVITRYTPNNRAEFIAFLNRGQEPTVLGRESINSEDMTISRTHCQFYQDEYGNIICNDKGSKNHTRVFTQKANSDGKIMTDPKNPAIDFTTWSLKPKDAIELLS